MLLTYMHQRYQPCSLRMGWCSDWSIRFIIGGRSFIPHQAVLNTIYTLLSKTLKAIFTASLFGAEHQRGSGKKKMASLVVVHLKKHLNILLVMYNFSIALENTVFVKIYLRRRMLETREPLANAIIKLFAVF